MHQLPFTELLNRAFAGPVDALLRTVGIHPTHPESPIPDHVAMQLLVVLLLTAFFVVIRLSLSVDRPGGPQHVIEGIQDFTGNLARDLIGVHYQEYLPYLITLGLFILTSNLLGLVPGL